MPTFEASASELMKRLLPLLIAALVTPVAASANHQEIEALLERATPHKVVYLIWKIGDEIRKVPPLPSAKWSQARGLQRQTPSAHEKNFTSIIFLSTLGAFLVAAQTSLLLS